MKILKNFFLNIYFTKKKTKSPNKKKQQPNSCQDTFTLLICIGM